MTQNMHVTVFGGTGFIGRYVIDRLTDMGATVRVATRSPASAYFLRTAGVVGQVVPVSCNIHDDASIEKAVQGSDWVINLVGTLTEKGKTQNFTNIHADFPTRLANIATKLNVKRFVHVSALGASETAPSSYLRSKAEGEQGVLRHYPDATILRPSVIFGAEDRFFNMFAEMASISPFLPAIGGGKTLFQPVYVDDVAIAVIKALTLPHDDVAGSIYELVGPDTYALRDIMTMVLDYTNKKAHLLNIPFVIAKVQGFILQYLPGQLLTADQVVSLTVDNVATGTQGEFADLGIHARHVDDIVPHYLRRFITGGRFANREKRAS